MTNVDKEFLDKVKSRFLNSLRKHGFSESAPRILADDGNEVDVWTVERFQKTFESAIQATILESLEQGISDGLSESAE